MKHIDHQPYFNLKETAHYLSVPTDTLIDCALAGGGPIHEFHRNEIFYRATDVDYFRLAEGFN
ncbi:MAG: hypothetical protein ABSD21_13075 [Rhizomicrobium sp.]|jgi:hypothetical protein